MDRVFPCQHRLFCQTAGDFLYRYRKACDRPGKRTKASIKIIEKYFQYGLKWPARRVIVCLYKVNKKSKISVSVVRQTECKRVLLLAWRTDNPLSVPFTTGLERGFLLVLPGASQVYCRCTCSAARWRACIIKNKKGAVHKYFYMARKKILNAWMEGLHENGCLMLDGAFSPGGCMVFMVTTAPGKAKFPSLSLYGILIPASGRPGRFARKVFYFMKKSRLIFPCLLVCLLLAACQTGGQQITPESSTSAQTSAVTTSAPTTTASESSISEGTTEAEENGPDFLYPQMIYSSQYKFQLTLPESWTGRYGIRLYEAGNIEFFHQGLFSKTNSQGIIFVLSVASREEFDEAFPDLKPGDTFDYEHHPWEHMLIGKNNRYVFTAGFPSSMMYGMDEAGNPFEPEMAREYNEMHDDIRGMRFEFIARDFTEPLH